MDSDGETDSGSREANSKTVLYTGFFPVTFNFFCYFLLIIKKIKKKMGEGKRRKEKEKKKEKK